jgi:SAM-dependent methyltransferase
MMKVNGQSHCGGISYAATVDPQRVTMSATNDWGRRVRQALALVRARRTRIKPFHCPLCGPSLLVKLDTHEIAVRCARCGATPIAMSIASVIRARIAGLGTAAVYELSARGPLHRFLQREAASLSCSQYAEGAVPGSEIGGVRVEDVQGLTFAASSFDVCTSTEVFEHVPDDRRAFAEMLRVLRPGGVLVFTVPIDLDAKTRERAAIVDGTLVHRLPPEYHVDPAAGHNRVLAFRDYGGDIVSRLTEAGFAQAEVVNPDNVRWFGFRRPVIIARK